MTAYKILGNSAPAATTDTTLVTGSTNGTVVSSFTACNTSGANDTIRVALVPNGGTLGTSNYVYYGFTLPANHNRVVSRNASSHCERET